MISGTLFKKNIKSNYKILLIFMAVLTMYLTIILGMYDPDNLDIMNMFAEMKLSPELLNALGFTLMDTSLLGFAASYFYGMLMLAFPMIFYIIVANKLVAAQIDKGSMAYILSTPNSRSKIVLTQVIFLNVCTIILVAFVTVLGILYCQMKFPDLLDIPNFILLNIGVWILHFAVSGICFFASCFFNESKNSLALGAGLPILFLLIQMLSNAGEKLENFKYATIFTLFNATNIIHREDYIAPLITLGVIGIVLYTLAVFVFRKKDIPV